MTDMFLDTNQTYIIYLNKIGDNFLQKNAIEKTLKSEYPFENFI